MPSKRTDPRQPAVCDGAARGKAVKMQSLSAEERHRRIAEAAYFRAAARGFVDARQIEDWLAAEREVDALTGALGSPPAHPPGDVQIPRSTRAAPKARQP